MDTEERDNWLDQLFARAKDLSPEDQQRFVEAECDETTIRVEVLELLKSYRDAPKQDFAHRILPNDAVVCSYEAVDSDATVTNDALLREGQIIGPYKILQVLGEGGMGTVYMAEQNEPIARRVAIKLIKPGMGCKEILARFDAERRALSMMEHPNIARVLDAGSDSGRSYFVMELVKGLPITEYCDTHRLPMKRRLELFGSVCRGVAHAHQKGIIHRDIKPSNVLVAEYDDDVVPKIIDFGVAKATTQKLTERTLFTRYGQLVGTVDYMSPEQAKLNQLDIDTRSDVYSLGVLLYEILVGMTPFDRKRLRSAALHEMLRIISEEDAPRLSKRFSTNDSSAEIAARRNIQPAELSHMLRGELDWIVTRSLEKDRNKRYQSVSEFADDIQRHLSGEAVAACPPTLRYRIGKFVRRYKMPVALTCLAILLLSISSAVGWSLYREAEVAREAESEARTEAESAKSVAEQMKEEAERRLKLSRVSRLAAESRAIADEDPSIGALLAIEAFESCQPTEEAAYSLAHAALLNSTQHLSQMGRPIKFDAAPISRLQFAGDYLVAESEQHVRLWMYTSPDPAETCQIIGGASNPTKLVDTSSDGQWLLTAGQNVEVWDLAGALAKAKMVVKGEVSISDLSPDGHWLVAAIPSPNGRERVLLYDLRPADVTQRLIGEYPSNSLKRLQVSADGKWVAVNEKSSNTVELFELNDENAKVEQLQLATSALEVLFSPNGRWLATAHEDDPDAMHAHVARSSVAILVWDLSRPDFDEPSHTMAAGSGQLFFSPDSECLYVRGNNSVDLIRWDLSAEVDPVHMKNSPRHVRGTSFSADGRWLLRGSCTGWASLFDIHQDRVEEVRTYSLGMITSAIDPSGRWVATMFKDGGIRIKDLHCVGDESIVMKGKKGPRYAPVAVSRTGRWIATLTIDDEIQLRDTHAEAVEESSRLLADASKLVGFSTDERFFAASGPAGTVSVWDLAADDVEGSRRPLGRGEATLTADSRWLITGDAPAGDVNIWDLHSPNSNAPRHPLSGHTGPVTSLVISTDGRWLVTLGPVGDSRKLMLWDLASHLATGNVSRVVLVEDFPSKSWPYRSSFSTDSRWLVADTGIDVGVWDLTKAVRKQPRRLLQSNGKNIWRLEISCNGRWVFTSRSDATAQLWDLRRENVQPIDLPTPGVQGSAISPDGRWLAMCKQGPTMQFFDLQGDSPANTRCVFFCPGDIMWNVAISGDNRWLVSASSEGTVRRWCLETNWGLDYAKRMTRRELRPDERLWYGVGD